MLFQAIHYRKLIGALLAGMAASLWVMTLHWNRFATLMLAAVLFFGAYGLFLLKAREPLVEEAYAQGLQTLKGMASRNKHRE